MAKDYNSYTFKPALNFPGAVQRNAAFPEDASALFLSVEDAENYARGNARTPDERELFKTSYAGQIIGVKNGVDDQGKGTYDAYIIQGDGTLKKIGSGGDIEYVSYPEAFEELSLEENRTEEIPVEIEPAEIDILDTETNREHGEAIWGV